MTAPQLATLMGAIAVVLAFGGMWFAWRARSRRDADVRTWPHAPTGETLAVFHRVMYVSTTDVNDPLTRIAAPGLKYRGYADVTVRDDGVTVEITSEDAAHFSAAQLRGSGSAGRRVGKAVESGGLALMRWVGDPSETGTSRVLESSFRFGSPDEQQRFLTALDQISPVSAQAEHTSTPQEDEQ